MSIDEAIAHERDVANEQKRINGICIQNDSECDKFSDCLKCAEEHEQLAEWLEELKCYKNDNDFSDYADRLHKISFNSGYNKAIDDFAENISLKISDSFIWGKIADCLKSKNINDTSDEIIVYIISIANEIAEQLKENI